MHTWALVAGGAGGFGIAAILRQVRLGLSDWGSRRFERYKFDHTLRSDERDAPSKTYQTAQSQNAEDPPDGTPQGSSGSDHNVGM